MPLRLLLPPSRGLLQTTVRAEVLAAALSDQMSRPVTVTVARDYAEIEHHLLSGETDLAWAPADICAQVADHARLILTAVRGGRAEYRAALIVRANEGLTIDNLAGKRAVWIDPRSTSGYLLPIAYLKSKGFDPDQFGSQTFAGSFRDALLAVLQGKADITAVYAQSAHKSAVRLSIAEHLDARESELTAIAFTASAPNDGLVFAGHLTQAEADELASALLAPTTTPDGRRMLFSLCNATGFVQSANIERAVHLSRPAVSTEGPQVELAVYHFDAANQCVDAWPIVEHGRAVGGDPERIFGADPGQRIRQLIADSRDSSSRMRLEYMVNLTGITRWYIVEALTGGEETTTAVVLHDHTSVKRMETQLIDLASFPLFNPIPVFEVDDRGKLVFANPAARRELPDLKEQGANHPVIAAARMIRSERTSASAVTERELAIGEQVFHLRVSDTDGQGLRVYAADVTQRHRAIEERKYLEAHMLEADRIGLVGTLAAGVVHEVNNPLAFVLANQSMALSNLRDLIQRLFRGDRGVPTNDILRETIEMLEDAHNGAERIRNTVRDLQVYSRRADADAPLQPIDIHRVLESAISMLRTEIRHRADLVRNFTDIPPVLGDEGRIGQVFLNLILNAAQAIPEGHATENEVRLRTYANADGEVVIEVSDTGVGIPPEEIEKVFEHFYTTKPVGVGTGLGLSISAGIVERMGGTLRVTSKVDSGTTFRVVLPPFVGTPMDAPVRVNAELDQSSGRRVLIIDDEPDVARALKRTLGMHDVTVLSSGRAGLECLKTEEFDVIFCDLMMPDGSGMDLYHGLAATRPAMAARIIFMTGGAFTPLAREFLARVDNPFLEKPFETSDVHRYMRESGAP